MPQWTEAQKKVIDSNESVLICSAAAGSGKTAVMVERIVRLIREGADPFSFLIITFTNAAAAEMKEKIRRRLLKERDNPYIAEAVEKAGMMEVCTIHAFCQHLIHQEFQTVGVDPFFQICTGSQREVLFQEAFRKACNDLKDAEDEDYRSFILKYDQETARDIVSTVWNFIMSLPDPFTWLLDKTENIPINPEKDHLWFQTISKMMDEQLQFLQVILRRQMDLFKEYEKIEAYRTVWLADSKLVEDLKLQKEGGSIFCDNLNADFVRIPPARNLNDHEIVWKDRYCELREQLKKGIAKIRSWVFTDDDRQQADLYEIRDALRGLRKITKKTDEAYKENKRQACVLDFYDLEHKALTILRDDNSREAVHERYSKIFVDECQDVSEIQNTLINMLTGENNTLFMVGDVKQSIYRFRMARPIYFQDRIRDAVLGKNVLYLQENFRSRPEILITTNLIFRDVMRQNVADMDYKPSDELIPGLNSFIGKEPVLVDLLEIEKKHDRMEVIAAHVANEIRKLINEGKYKLNDIVILMSEVSTDGSILKDLLRKKGIDVFFDGKGDFFDQHEVEVFRSLLMIMDNPHMDLALMTVLVNPPFCFTEEELSQIRLNNSGKGEPFWQAFEIMVKKKTQLAKKCAEAQELLKKWRFLSSHMPLSDYLWYLMENSGLYAIMGTKANGKTVRKNLRSLCIQGEKAQKYGICTLREFLLYLEDQGSGVEMLSASELADTDQVVRIMTMHKAKGLQFPVVFCLGLGKGLTGKPGGVVRLNTELGICLRHKVPEYRLSRKTRVDEIFEWQKSHDVRAEKICLLYVAMTRAQEKLFLVGEAQDRPIWHAPAGDHRTLAATDYLDWIMPVLLDNENVSTSDTQASKPWKIRKIENNQQKIVERTKNIHSLKTWLDSVSSNPVVDELWKTYKIDEVNNQTEHPIRKYSVTALVDKAENQFFMNDEQTPEEKRTPDNVLRAIRRCKLSQKPAFMMPKHEADGASRGTVVHRFLSLMDLEKIRKADKKDLTSILEELRLSLKEKGVFSPVESDWIRVDKIISYLSSSLGQRMLASPEIHREWDFNLALRDRGALVQGMIDCVFREGDKWVLVDYKTDHIEDENEFVENYRPQLAWYSVALEKLTGMPVKECWLYALSVDKMYSVPIISEEHETAGRSENMYLKI